MKIRPIYYFLCGDFMVHPKRDRKEYMLNWQLAIDNVRDWTVFRRFSAQSLSPITLLHRLCFLPYPPKPTSSEYDD